MYERYAHIMRPISVTRIPTRHVILDTEATVRYEDGVQVQEWGHACTTWLDAEPRRRVKYGPVIHHADANMLAEWINWVARERAKTVVWAHNLAYDLRISKLLRELPRRGWTLEGVVLARTASWCGWRSGDRSILFVDLYSWLPASLDQIAADMDLSRTRYRPARTVTQRMRDHCYMDVVITREAVYEIVRYLRDQDMGPFRPTGAGQSHVAYRRNWMSHRLLCHDNHEALRLERAAAWTGRCEAHRWGDLRDGPYTEYDIQLAYAHIGRECEVPVTLVGETRCSEAAEYLALRERYAVLAEVEYETMVPGVPTSIGDHMAWPIGSFRTTLWDPDIDIAVANGRITRWGRVFIYRRAPALHDFCAWLLHELCADESTATPIQRRLLKHWSRALIGRMAVRYHEWEPWGVEEHADLVLSTMLDADTGATTELLQAGPDIFTLSDMKEGDNSLPQITSWIMAEARRRLWSLMLRASLDRVAYVDTDSLIVDPTGATRLEIAKRENKVYSLRKKGTYRHLHIRGPRNYTADGVVKVSGVPLSASPVDRRLLGGEVWRGLHESIMRGELESVVVIPRTFDISGSDYRRRRIANGMTAPITVNSVDTVEPR